MICPICSEELEPRDVTSRTIPIDCVRCGPFFATTDFIEIKPDEFTQENVGNASGWISEHPNVTLKSDDWIFLKSLATPSVGDKAVKLLQLLARNYPKPSKTFPLRISNKWLSTCWAIDSEELKYLFLSYLILHKQFVTKDERHASLSYAITPTGWDYLYSLNYANKDSQIGFCAMWFDKAVTPLWTDGIKPAIENAGYEAKRIDKHQHNNRIDDEIIAMIRRSKFIVADFTANRGGLF